MGYMGLTCPCDSDNASELKFSVIKGIVKKLRKGLKQKTNEYNTQGPVNVVLVFEEIILPISNHLWVHEEMTKLASDTITELEKLIKQSKEAEWSNEGNRQMHVKAYQRMIKSMNKHITNMEKISASIK
jgi:hypothetical protein